MKDRVPGAPGQYAATIAAGEFAKLERGNPFSITLIRDDHPLVEGTPYSKATVLPDEVATILCPGMEDPSPADAFKALVNRTKAKAGFIYPFAGDTDKVPDGFLLCNGDTKNRTEYEELYDAIGLMYTRDENGDIYDDGITFKVPNLSKRVPVGAGAGAGEKYALGKMDGKETHQLTVEEMPNHRHQLTEHDGKQINYNQSAVIGGNGIGISLGETWDNLYTSYVGSNVAHNNMQPYTVVNYIIATGKGETLGYAVASAADGGNESVIDDGVVSLDKTWSSQKIADEIANISGGSGGGNTGDHPDIVTDFGAYTTLADYIKNGMEDNSAVICYYTGTKLSDFPDTSSLPGYPLDWCIEIHKSNSSSAEINARASNQFSAMQAYTHRWNGMYSGYSIDWKQIELYTGGGGGAADSVMAQGISNGWAWRTWSNGFAECWKTVSCSTISGNVVYATETLPVEIKTNRTILATQSDTSFTAPTTEISKFTSAFAPGVSNPIRIFAQKTENFATGNSVSASVYVCGNCQ